ncbi:hypothetical protein EC973_008925 [Apophysomyces ossiformis]|uniref:Uncharacterized protein n=1 Tax=Apophysomyces ossiformis TaxID=679940 RepID=A0A8H7ETC8_9FUNG|nr:hypothetical protein EC973_008925 [Apophysomyces ossiformis]
MKFPLLATGTLFLLSALVNADDYDGAIKKFCGGLAITDPTQGASFADPHKVTVTVSKFCSDNPLHHRFMSNLFMLAREPNSEQKVVNAVDVYSVGSNGKPSYLGTAWKGNYALNKKAKLTVDVTKAPNVKLPSQFVFRVWVHNKAGPDCTLMSKVFKVSSGSHTNEDTQQMQNMNQDIDRGCFAVEVVEPKLGAHLKANSVQNVQIARDSMSLIETFNGVTLHKVDLHTHKYEQVQNVWTGRQNATEAFNVKDTLSFPGVANGTGYAYFYKIQSLTSYNELCYFYSHPFYIE